VQIVIIRFCVFGPCAHLPAAPHFRAQSSQVWEFRQGGIAATVRRLLRSGTNYSASTEREFRKPMNWAIVHRAISWTPQTQGAMSVEYLAH